MVYAILVAGFETMIGVMQPTVGDTLVISTTDDAGVVHDRVLARLESGGQMYVAANHWPRAWYRQALAHPRVGITIDGERGDYTAVPVTGSEASRVHAENDPGLGFRVMTGFPPRRFLRLDPVPPAAG
ncbi:MAG: nitroreductase/quinone reductase family protein [Myxococcota bacterium]